MRPIILLVLSSVFLVACGSGGEGTGAWDEAWERADGGTEAADAGPPADPTDAGDPVDAGPPDPCAAVPEGTPCADGDPLDGEEYCRQGRCLEPPEADPALWGITRAHNRVRAEVSPAPAVPLPPLVWSEDLAAGAQLWADACTWAHSSQATRTVDGVYVGENLYASSGRARTPDEVVGAWASEAADYDYAGNTCSGVCGHYTQIVWRETTEVGCAVTVCDTVTGLDWEGAELWVCHYRPGGNIVGRRPY